MEATTLTEAGYGVSVICPKGKGLPFHETLQGVSIYRYPLPSMDGIFGHLLEYGIALPATFFLTCLVYLRHGFQVIQSANPPDLFFLIANVFKLLGVRFVFDHHDLMPEICDSRWTGWKRKLMRAFSVWSEHATFKSADRVIATNESYRNVAITRGGVPKEHVVVVRSGPRLSSFTPEPPVRALRNGCRYLVCYLGVMGPNDGLDYLLRSIHHIVKNLHREDIQFTLIGGGDLQPGLVKMSRELGLEDYVTFTGRIPDDEVKAIISTADIGVAPDPKDALNDVSTMNKIIEYMALGTPLVAFDLKEARVSAGESALYAQPNDIVDFAGKIIALLASPEHRYSMGRLARERFENTLAWEHQAEKLINLYHNLIGIPAPVGTESPTVKAQELH